MSRYEKLTHSRRDRLAGLVRTVFSSNRSRFYRDYYCARGVDPDTLVSSVDFERLPVLTREELRRAPLNVRRYNETGRSVVKVIRSGGTPFLMQRGLSDIAKDSYGLRPCERPLVFCSDSDTTLEISLWCYEQNILPLAGEPNNLSSTAHFAAQYGIDALITEPRLLTPFLSQLSKHYSLQRIQQTVLVDAWPGAGRDNEWPLLSVPPTRILYLPETGPFAENCLQRAARGTLVFHPHRFSVVEICDGNLVLTKLSDLPTPLIRYDTELTAEWADAVCVCGEDSLRLCA